MLGDIINHVYGSNISNSRSSTPLSQLMSNIFRFEHDLAEWIQGLPSYLVPISSKQSNRDSALGSFDVSQFQVINTLRYLNVRMLLHRAVLSHLLGAAMGDVDSTKEDFAFGFAGGSIEKCLDAAMRTISIISRSLHKQEVLPIYWYSIYFCKCSSNSCLVFLFEPQTFQLTVGTA